MKYFDNLLNVNPGWEIEKIQEEYHKVLFETNKYIKELEGLVTDLLRLYTRDIQGKVVKKDNVAIGYGLANYVNNLKIGAEVKTNLYNDLNLNQVGFDLLDNDKLGERTKYLQLLEADLRCMVNHLKLPLYTIEFQLIESKIYENRLTKVLFTYAGVPKESIKALLQVSSYKDENPLINKARLLELEIELYTN